MPLRDNQIEQYLKTDQIAGAKWGTYMVGASGVSPEWIQNASQPELSVLRYCTMERQKNQLRMMQSGGGGLLG